MKSVSYILDEDNNIVESDMLGYCEWLKKNESRRIVGRTQVGDILVSTVFLGIDHRFYGKGSPVLFETMCFGGFFDEQQHRYCTWAEALQGHEAFVTVLKRYTEEN